MSLSGLAVLLAVALGTLTFVAWPLISQPVARDDQPPRNSPDAPQPWDALQTSYEQAVGTVRDLDFDFQTGKLAAEAHRQQRAALMVTAADLLRQIDQLKAEAAEKAISERRQQRATIQQQAEVAISAERQRARTSKR